jgi:tetratricopeptide (TPR) repeat protein
VSTATSSRRCYPYQASDESASGAVRLGLAAGRPVVTTKLPVFADVSEVVYELDGCGPVDIAEGIIALLQDEPRKAELLRRQRDWLRANSWSTQANRLANIILGCVEEARGVALRSSAVTAALSRVAADPEPADAPWSPSEDLVAALQRLDGRAPGATDARRVPAISEIVESPLSPRVARTFGFLRGPGTKRPSPDRKNPEKKLLSRADRARDLRDWMTAARYYREALDRRPDDPVIWVQYGHALKESGHLPDAESAYRTALELDGEIADTHLQLGHALKIQGRKIEASVAYLRALALDPALDHAARELQGLGWTPGRIQLTLRRERSAGR